MVLVSRSGDDDTDTFHQAEAIKKKPELLKMLKKHKFHSVSVGNLNLNKIYKALTSKKSKENFYAILDFFVVYAACYLTPISIMVQQEYDASSFLTISLLLCDVRFFYHCCKKLVTQKYKTRLELIMLLFSFPTIFAWPIFSVYSTPTTPNYWMWFSFTRMMKLMVLNARYNELSNLMEQASVTFTDMMSRVTKTILFFFMYANLLACFWFYISCRDRRVCRSELQVQSYHGMFTNIHDTWVIEDIYIHTNSVASCYFRSLHFIVVSLLTVGYGDIYPVNTYEMCFTLYLMLNGVLFYGFLISSITSILASKDYTTKAYRTMIGELKEYFKLRNPNNNPAIEKLRDYFINYYEHLYTKQFGMSESDLFKELPVSLAREMKMTHFMQLKKIGFFHVQHDLFVEMCLDKMTYVTYSPETTIENNKDELKLIVMGKVHLMTKNGAHNVYTYHTGDSIGEFDFIFHDRTGARDGGHTPKHQPLGEDMGKSLEDKYDAISSGYTTALVLDYNSFCEVVHEFSLLSLDHATNDIKISAQSIMDEFADKAALYVRRLNEEQNERLRENEEVQSSDKNNSIVGGTGTKAKLPVSNGTKPVLVPGGPAGVSPTSTPGKTDPPLQSMLVKRGSVSNFHRSLLHTVLTTGEPKSKNDIVTDYDDPYVLNLTQGFAKANKNYRSFAEKVSKVQSAVDTKARRRGVTAFMSISTVSISTNGTIDPASVWTLLWSLTLFCAIIYYSIAIPLRIMSNVKCGEGHSAKYCLSQWWYSLVVDYFCDFLFIVDFILRARFFAFRKHNGEVETVVTEPWAIYQRFQYSFHFYMDIAMAFPIDLIAIGSGYLLCWRLVKLGSLLLLPKILVHIQSYMDRELSINVNAETMTVVNLAIATVLLAIWIGVGFEIIRYDGRTDGFMTSYYWTFTTMTTTGYGDIHPQTLSQTIYTVFVSFLAPTIFATIIGKFASYVKVVDISTENVEHRLTTIQQFLKTSIFNGELEAEISVAKEDEKHTMRNRRSLADLKVPKFSQQEIWCLKYFACLKPKGNFFASGRYRVAPSFSQTNLSIGPTDSGKKIGSNVAAILELLINEYYEYISGKSVAGLNETKLVKHGMPNYLKHKIRIMVVEDLIRNASVFDAFDEEFRNELMLSLEQVFFCKKHMVLKKTVPADGMYFIKSGTLKFRHSSETVYRIKGQGESIAEYSLFVDGNNAPLYEIVAVADCELWYLSRADFQKALHKFPANHQHMPHTRQQVEKMTELHRTSVMNVLQVQAKAAEKQKMAVSPTSTWMYLWTELIVVVTLYNLFVIPLRIAFYQNVNLGYPLYLDYIGDLIFVLDMILKGSLVAYNDQEDLIRSNKKIFLHYIRSVEFRYHLVAVIPTDLFAYAGRIGTLGTMQTIALLRINKLLRLYDLHANMLAIEYIFLHVMRKFFNIRVDVNLIRIAKLVAVMVSCAYVIGCVFFIIANQNHLAHNYNNWADVHKLFTTENDSAFHMISNQCIHSVYWAMQVMTTTGYGDMIPVNDHEKLYNIFIFVVGTFLFATIIVYLQDIVSQLDVTSDLHKRRITRIQEFLHREQMSRDYLEKVSKYYTILWSHQRGAESKEIAEFIPQRLYLASIYNVARNPMNDLFFVNKCSAVFQNAFISRLLVRHYLVNDSLFRDGERGNTLFLVHSGEVCLIAFDDATADSNTRSSFDEGNGRRRRSNTKSVKKKQTRTLYLNVRDGFIGESEFFSRACYACSGIANMDSILYEIDFESFWELIIEQRLVNNFTKTVGREGMRLHRNSTLLLVKKMNANIKNSKLARMMDDAVYLKRNDGTLLPDAIVVQVWNTVCLIILGFEAIMVPYFIAFDGQNHALQLALDTIFVIIGALDIVGQLFWFAVELEGNLITEASVFRKMYMKERLVLDVIGTLPVSLFYFAATQDFKVYRFIRLMYLVRLSNLLSLLMKFYRTILFNFRVKIKMAKLRVIYTLIVYAYVIHMVACAFAFLGKYELFLGRKNWIRGNHFSGMTDKFVYLRAFYWAMYSSTTIGYGSIVLHNNAERVFAAMTMILGSILTATLSAMLSAIVENADSAKSSLRRTHEAANKFCQTHHVQPEIRAKISSYFTYMNESLISSRESEDLKLLSSSLKAEYVLNKIWKEAKKISFLDSKLFDKSMQYGFICSIVRYFDVYLAVPQEVLLQIPLQQLQIIKKKEKTYKYLSRDLFFLRRGLVYSTIRDPEHCSSPLDANKKYFSANQVIELSGMVQDAPPDKTAATSVKTELEPKYTYSVKLLKMSINQNDDSGGVIKIATTSVSVSKNAVGDYTSSSVEFNKRKGMFNASFTNKTDKPTPLAKDDTVLFFDVCVGHTYAKEFTYHVGGAVFKVPDILKRIDKKVEEDDDDSSSGDDFIKSHRHVPPATTEEAKKSKDESPPAPALVEEIPESVPIRLFNSFTPFAASFSANRRTSKSTPTNRITPASTSGSNDLDQPLRNVAPQQKFGSFLMSSGAKGVTPKSVPVTPKAGSGGTPTGKGPSPASPKAGGGTPTNRQSIAYADDPDTVDLSIAIPGSMALNKKPAGYAALPSHMIKERDNEGDDDESTMSDEDDDDSGRPKPPKIPGTFVDTMTALILDDSSDAIIGTVTIQITAVKIEDPDAPPEKPATPAVLKRRFSTNLLGVGEKNSPRVPGKDSPKVTGDTRKSSIETLKAIENGVQRRLSEVLRVVDSVKIVPPGLPQGLQRRLSNVALTLVGEEVPHPSNSNEINMESHTANAVAVSEGYAHLFRVPVSKLQEVESFFLMSLQTANHRINALPKKITQKNR